MSCGRSSSVEWKLPKLQRRVRFPSPAPPRPAARRAVLLCLCWGFALHEGPTHRRHAVRRLRVVPPAGMKGARQLQNLDAPFGAKNFAHRTYKHGEIETNNTTARFPELTNETASTFASPQQLENQHFPRAKASPVSSQRSHKVAKASPVSPQRSDALDTEPMHQIAQQCTGN